MTDPSKPDDIQRQAHPHGARDLIFEELHAVASFWPQVRDDPDLGPSEALDVLALWGHARRFLLEGEHATQFKELDKLVQDDTERLIEYALQNPVLAQWQEQTEELDNTWANVLGPFEIMDCEDGALDLFVTLDRYDLARYAISRLLPKVPAGRRKELDVEKFARTVTEAEEFFDDRVEVFQSAAGWTNELLSDYRPDLDTFDEPLWKTTLKYGRLEALLEEQDDAPRLSRIDPDTLPSLATPERAPPAGWTIGTWSVSAPPAAAHRLAASAAGAGGRKSVLLFRELIPPEGNTGKILLAIHEEGAGKLTIECRTSEKALARCQVRIVFKVREKELDSVSMTLDRQDADGVWVSSTETDRPRGKFEIEASVQLAV